MTEGTLERTESGARLRFERRFAHPVERVWAAITRPEELAQWFLPFEAEIELDLVEGGTYVMRMADPDSTVMTFTVLRVEPPRLFEHTAMDDGTMRWELEPDGDGCLLVLTQTMSSYERAVENHYASGMHHSLERLEFALGGKPIDWSWPRWEELRDQYVAMR
jgi:uncharacterized protein YndB with AHSA1/START domain